MTRSWSVTLLLVAGCAPSGTGWAVDQVPTPLPAEERYEVLTRRGSYLLHAVTLDADSLRGVQWGKPADCQECRVAVPRSTVEMVRLAPDDSRQYLIFLGTMAAIALIWFTFPRPT